METIKFLIQGSQPEPYNVVFLKTEKGIKISCSCAAGIISKYCKHKNNLILGYDIGMVSQNREDITLIKTWLRGSSIMNALDELIQLENRALDIKKAISMQQKKISRLCDNP